MMDDGQDIVIIGIQIFPSTEILSATKTLIILVQNGKQEYSMITSERSPRIPIN